MCATAHEGLDLKGAVPAAHDLRRVHLGMIDAVRAGEGSARVAALAARELDDTVAIVLGAIDLAVIEPRTSERKLAAVRRYVSDCPSGVAAPAPDDLVGELLLDDSHRPERGTVGQTRRIRRACAGHAGHRARVPLGRSSPSAVHARGGRADARRRRPDVGRPWPVRLAPTVRRVGSAGSMPALTPAVIELRSPSDPLLSWWRCSPTPTSS